MVMAEMKIAMGSGWQFSMPWLAELGFEQVESGHTRHMWDTEDPTEVEAAEQIFNTLTGRGYAAFSVKEGGRTGEPMRTFNPESGAMVLKMVMVPPMRGG
jgi:hypothetical protein